MSVVLLHEGLHGGVGRLLGHRPIFGLKPPLVYTTFEERIPRGHLVLIALAPLLVLDCLFVAAYTLGVLRLFMVFGFAINTIGAVGDLWIVAKVLPRRRGSMIEDTKWGLRVFPPGCYDECGGG